jgi:hypothetical protein
VLGSGNPSIQHRDDRIAVRDRERAAVAEVSLRVDENQGIARLE